MNGIVKAVGLAGSTLVLGVAAPAAAKGCNGYVNQMQWGCAPWDNNNGPQYPHYVAPAPSRTTYTSSVVVRQPATPLLAIPSTAAKSVSTTKSGLIGQDGNGLIGQDGNGFKPK